MEPLVYRGSAGPDLLLYEFQGRFGFGRVATQPRTYYSPLTTFQLGSPYNVAQVKQQGEPGLVESSVEQQVQSPIDNTFLVWYLLSYLLDSRPSGLVQKLPLHLQGTVSTLGILTSRTTRNPAKKKKVEEKNQRNAMLAMLSPPSPLFPLPQKETMLMRI
ncbi:hypothetical protein L209DRAFT_491931 [Thermothelomyces heterothallicus CBS 203.75]